MSNWVESSIGTKQVTSHYLNQWCSSLLTYICVILTHICVTWPQWINTFIWQYSPFLFEPQCVKPESSFFCEMYILKSTSSVCLDYGIIEDNTTRLAILLYRVGSAVVLLLARNIIVNWRLVEHKVFVLLYSWVSLWYSPLYIYIYIVKLLISVSP